MILSKCIHMTNLSPLTAFKCRHFSHLLNKDQEEITLNILDEEIAKIIKEDDKENLKNKHQKSEIEEIKEDEDLK
uniref:Uncharacterized protein n=1 Tax=Meloidogyne enterolobii TaxID=390850 RepID=A0A6V7XBV7_MELEN|nr:unnamed protein product [Meloidogyne enterolobii]